jgi:SAM-dependent methyltransferase
MTCLNCGQTMMPYFVKKTFEIYRCDGCALMAVKNVPDDLRPFYSQGYFTGDTTLDGYMDYDLDKEVTKKTYRHFLDVIGGYVLKKDAITMFEVGCATGFFMALAEEKGWKTFGIDISEYAAKKAAERGLAVTASTLEDFSSGIPFDVVVMQDVIEHVKDPIATINKAYSLTAKGGLLVLTTPDAGSLWARVWGKRWHAFVPPQHLFYFTVQNLSALVEKNGFKVVYVGHHGKWFAIPYIVRLLYSWTGLAVFSWLAGLLAKSPLKSVALPINVRDTIYLIARKV